ncbi:DUF692 family multinuclear iron-containing protein [Streptomyces sp. NPDC058084]|uniref:multinuclear nonheme iron-dependent oxidase n=1 Tax=Streptomyces sp. NPDC058084 TaxID=3346333 RepID=UPI0036E38E4E
MKELGIGIGWRPEIADAVEALPGVDWVEVVAENVCAGHLPDSLQRLRARGVTVVPHGVSLGLGGADRPDAGRLAALAEKATALGAPLVTEHIAFVRAGGPLTATPLLEAGHLLPVPRTWDALEVLCENVRVAQDALPVPLALENIAALVAWPGEELTEGQFLSELVERTGVRLLIDVANLHTNHVNRGEDPAEALSSLPVEAIAYVHVAGGLERDGVWHDTHAHPVSRPVLDILADLASRVSPPGVLLERDDHFPAPRELAAELSAIRATVTGARPRPLLIGAGARVSGGPMPAPSADGEPRVPAQAPAGAARVPAEAGARTSSTPVPAGAARAPAEAGARTSSVPVPAGATRAPAEAGARTSSTPVPAGATRAPAEAGARTSSVSAPAGATRIPAEAGARTSVPVPAEAGARTSSVPAPAGTGARSSAPGAAPLPAHDPAVAAPGAAAPSAGAPAAARQRVAVAEAALLSALVAGTPTPEGFDVRRLGVQSRALAAKRADVVAKVAPELPEILGEGYRPAFLAYARNRPMTDGYRHDALDFVEGLLVAGRPEDPDARRRLTAWWKERAGIRPPGPAARLAHRVRTALGKG